MTDLPRTPAEEAPTDDPSTGKTVGETVAETIDAILWDYDPEGAQLSPLVSCERYFRDFPWDGD